VIENDILLSPQTFSRVNIYYQNYDELVQLVQTPEISVLKHKSGGYLEAVVDTAFGLCGYLNTVYPHVNVTDSTGNYGDVIRLAQAVNSDPFVVY